MLDGEADVSICYAADIDDPPFEDESWKKANPSWEHMPVLVAAIRRGIKKAEKSSEYLQTFKALRLNMGVADTYIAVLLSSEEWTDTETDGPPMRIGPYVLGGDMGGAAAMSAIAAYWPQSGWYEVMSAFPEIPSLEEREIADAVLKRSVPDHGGTW